MDMLEDYLRAVSRLLPRTKRDDIIAELRDEILTRIEAKEAELGRTLTDDETEQLLHDFGHPIALAARYRDEPQYAVGPALYPFWSLAVRLVILIQIGISAIVFLARLLTGANIAEAFGAAVGSGLTGAVMLIGFATIAAWVIERKGITIDYLTHWRVRDLRFLDFAVWDWSDIQDWTRARKDGVSEPGHLDVVLRRSVAGRGINYIIGAGFTILWWTGVIRFGLSSMNFSALPVDFGALAEVDWPALKTVVYWPVMAYLAVLIAFGAAMVAAAVPDWPRMVRLRGAIDILLGAVVLGVVAWVWFASPVASVVSVASVQELVSRVTAQIAHPLPLSVPLMVTIGVLLTAFEALSRVLLGIWEAATGIPR